MIDQKEKEEMFLNAVRALEVANNEFQCMLNSVANSMNDEQNEAIQLIRKAYHKTISCCQDLVSKRTE